MTALLWYGLAALGEIAGCFAFWAWLRLGKSPLWTLPGVVSLVVFALALTRIDAAAAGRATASHQQNRSFCREFVAEGLATDLFRLSPSICGKADFRCVHTVGLRGTIALVIRTWTTSSR